MLRSIFYSVLLIFVSAASGQDVALTSVMRSQYVYGNGNPLHDKPVIQTDLCLSFSNGLWADVWGSVPCDLADTGKDYGTELYLTAGWAKTVGSYHVSLGVGYDDLYHADRFEGSDWGTVIFEASKDFHPLRSFAISPFVHIETYFIFDGSVIGDTFPRLGSYYSLKLSEIARLEGKGYLLYDPGILSNKAMLMGDLDTSVHWKSGKNSVLEFPYFRVIAPLTTAYGGRKFEAIWGAGITVKF